MILLCVLLQSIAPSPLPRAPMPTEQKLNRKKSLENKENHEAMRARFKWVDEQNKRMVKDGVKFITEKRAKKRKKR